MQTNEILYELVRSKRKTLALTIDRDARLVVRAPLALGEDVIQEFVRKKSRWIADKQRQIIGSKQIKFVLEDGEDVLYLGKSYTVARRDATKPTIEGKLLIIPDDMTLDDFVGWVKSQGEVIFRGRVDHYASLMGVRYTSIKLSEAKRQWGSCGARNTLNFAWRLVMCPQSVIDYVVVHELSHIIHKNHSAKFWTLVKKVIPGYKEAQGWLRMNRGLMEAI